VRGCRIYRTHPVLFDVTGSGYPHIQQVKLAGLDKVDAFHCVHFKYKLPLDRHVSRDFSESDVVLLSDSNNVSDSPSRPLLDPWLGVTLTIGTRR
jgi:hypothetical protein